mmetsp:Transcript_4540/g.7303  ORF Transcript_4540/g.7303 Transcript_4540/m.7303 type:complete len:267 (+) Transcript_4540:432-1232(+)
MSEYSDAQIEDETPQDISRTRHPLRPSKILGYIVASPEDFVIPQKCARSCTSIPQQHLEPAAMYFNLRGFCGLKKMVFVPAGFGSGTLWKCSSFFGENWFLLSPWPKRPYPPKPHVHTFPSIFVTMVCAAPQATSAIVSATSSSMTRGRTSREYSHRFPVPRNFPSVPCPSTPSFGYPHEYTFPALLATQENERPAPAVRTPSIVDTRDGFTLLDPDWPVPSCPNSLLPLVYKAPFLVNQRECLSPQAPPITGSAELLSFVIGVGL